MNPARVTIRFEVWGQQWLRDEEGQITPADSVVQGACDQFSTAHTPSEVVVRRAFEGMPDFRILEVGDNDEPASDLVFDAE